MNDIIKSALTLQPEEYNMHLESERLKSFRNWPFNESCNCTPEKMAQAGWYHCPTNIEPDAVRCFLCFKELDGWEPNDDPWSEHKKHSPDCPFLKFDRKLEQMTVEEFLKVEMQRQKYKLKKIISLRTKEFEDQADEVRHEMEQLAH